MGFDAFQKEDVEVVDIVAGDFPWDSTVCNSTAYIMVTNIKPLNIKLW